MKIYNNYDDDENSNMSTIAIRKIGSTLYIPCRVIKASVSDKNDEVSYNIVPEKYIDEYNEYLLDNILAEFNFSDMITPEQFLSTVTVDDLKNELNKRNILIMYK